LKYYRQLYFWVEFINQNKDILMKYFDKANVEIFFEGVIDL